MGGYNYYISFINNHSRYRWINLLCEELDSLDALQTFKATIELKSSKVIKCVRSNKSDNYYGRYIKLGRNLGPFVLFL